MKLLLAFLLINLTANAADTNGRIVRRTNYVAGPQYPASTNEFRPHVVFTGPNSQVRERGAFRITSRDEWVSLWLRHTGQTAEGKYSDGRYQYWTNPGGVPEIDFTRCIVVALFQGPGFNSGGFNVAEVVNHGDATVLRLAEKWYQTINSSRDVTAYGLFVMPHSRRPLVIEENVQHSIGGPPIWKERIRFDK